jgi:hypothetical protein
MKKIFLSYVLLIIPLLGFTQKQKEIDSSAIYILDQMSDLIGDLNSVTFKTTTSTDKLNDKGLIVTHYSTSEVSMVGPDKLIAKTRSDKGGHGNWYNGEYLSYYSYAENNYLTLEAPDNIISMVDDMHTRFDFKFPAMDFFYPSFTDDIIESFDTIQYVGKRTIEEEECYQIMAINNEMHVQLWVSEDRNFLPKKMKIIYKNQNNIQYTTTFTSWVLNPQIPETIFEFLPPPKAKLISILEK